MARNKSNREETYNSPFATTLRKLMEERGTSQGDVATITSRTRQTVSQYVNGVSEPPYDTLVKIADYFNVPTDYLLGRTNDPSTEPSAVDSLGISPEVANLIKQLSTQAKENDLGDFDNFLSVFLSSPVFLLLKPLCDDVQSEILAKSNPVFENDSMPVELESRITERILLNELRANHPEIANRITVIFGTRKINESIEIICKYFRMAIEHLSGYDKLTEMQRHEKGVPNGKY